MKSQARPNIDLVWTVACVSSAILPPADEYRSAQHADRLELAHHAIDPLHVEIEAQALGGGPGARLLGYRRGGGERGGDLKRGQERRALVGVGDREARQPVILVVDEALLDRVAARRIDLAQEPRDDRGLLGAEHAVGDEEEPE